MQLSKPFFLSISIYFLKQNALYLLILLKVLSSLYQKCLVFGKATNARSTFQIFCSAIEVIDGQSYGIENGMIVLESDLCILVLVELIFSGFELLTWRRNWSKKQSLDQFVSQEQAQTFQSFQGIYQFYSFLRIQQDLFIAFFRQILQNFSLFPNILIHFPHRENSYVYFQDHHQKFPNYYQYFGNYIYVRMKTHPPQTLQQSYEQNVHCFISNSTPSRLFFDYLKE